MHNTITVNGSHGSIVVHRISGHVIEADECDCADCAKYGDYQHIRWFDPARWDDCARKYGETDILNTAYVYKAQGGTYRYEREASVVMHGDPDWPDYYLDYLPLLPAPSGRKEPLSYSPPPRS